MKLLTIGNPKIEKGKKFGFLTSILHLAPHTLSGWNVCPMASKGCAMSCLNTAGRGGMIKLGETTNYIQQARITRTRMFFEEREKFMAQLVDEIRSAISLAEKNDLTPVFRLNGTSDLRWEIFGVTVDGVDYPNIMAVFPNIQFYDYTAIPNRRIAHIPNYHLTFSRKETHTEQDVYDVLANGMNVAVVFGKDAPKIRLFKSLAQKLAERSKRDAARERNADKPKKSYQPRKIDLSWVPENYAGFPTHHGDNSDLRFMDPKGVVVALVAKGAAKYDTSGFVVFVKTISEVKKTISDFMKELV
ncbi:hypothetical protein LCGC14_2598820 [marine sediment metagenome]|uniref:Gene product 88 domain-containing protein n=1 Tax=marine sediment metagenome TaxID=412755 RepID=A0A0F9A9E2_9ZZZZ